jgi:hypothetical protein
MSKMKFQVIIDDKRKYTLKLGEDLAINEEDLDQLLCDQPSRYVRYATIAGMARSKVERLEYKLEELEANLDLAIREKKEKQKVTKEEGGEKLTEGKIKSIIITNSTRLALVNELMEAKEQYEISNAAKDASGQKKDCLISIGANRRAQYDSELSLKSKK